MPWRHQPEPAAQTPGSSPGPGQEPGESEAHGMPPIPSRAGGDDSSAQQVQQLQSWRGRKSWRPLQRHEGSVGIEEEPAGSQRLQGGLLLPNPAVERQGKQLRECLMAGAPASAAFTAPILQHLCWLAGAKVKQARLEPPPAFGRERCADRGEENVLAGANSDFTLVTRCFHSEGICLWHYF